MFSCHVMKKSHVSQFCRRSFERETVVKQSLEGAVAIL